MEFYDEILVADCSPEVPEELVEDVNSTWVQRAANPGGRSVEGSLNASRNTVGTLRSL